MKKVLSIVLSLAMVVCMMPLTAFAASSSNTTYSDIAGEKCEGAVNVLSALGVVNGYEDGTYKPATIVTRAEMAKLIITALGMDSYATATTSSYTDMTNAKWAVPVVEYATNLGIINGYGNGKFGPNDTVTYEQAATMIVRALGYTTDCSEMNGTYPAIYIQKATALGIFKDVDGNQYGTGANRGDIAIMLYNALDVPEVYADKDGQTLNKRGAYNSATKDYDKVTMMSTLNKDGDSKYVVVTSQMADDAITNIREYIGAAAKVTTDKNDHVIAVGDIQTTFLTGKVSNDGKKIEVGDTEYTLPTSLDDYVDVDENTGGKKAKSDADKIVNGETEGVATDKLAAKAKVTIAAKVSGKTVKEIYSVAEWKVSEADIVTDSQINTIKNKQTLLGKDFTLNDDREIDETSFELIGVDSLDKIEKDDVVYVYVANTSKEITRVAVGQKVVNGELTKVTDNNKKYTVDGTTYKRAIDEVSGITSNSSDYSIASDVAAGDDVEITLDAYGYIYKLKADSANRQYAAVLKYGVDNDAYGSKTYSLKLLTGNGDTLVANVDDDYEEDYLSAMDNPGQGNVDQQTIVKYHLNSSNEIDFIEKVTQTSQGDKKKVSSGGYYDGYALASNVVIFSYNGGTDPKDYADADNYSVVSYDSAIGKEFKASYALNSDDKIVLMVADDLVADDVIFGIVTGSGSNNSDAGYYVDILTTDGKTITYDCSSSVRTGVLKAASGKDNITDLTKADYKNLMGFKVSSNNELKANNFEAVPAGSTKDFLNGDDVMSISGQIVSIENSRVKIGTSTYGYTDNVVVYKYDKDDAEFQADGSTSDLEEGNTVAMFDIEGEDGVYDVIVIMP